MTQKEFNNLKVGDTLDLTKVNIKLSSEKEIDEWVDFARKNINSTLADGGNTGVFTHAIIARNEWWHSYIDTGTNTIHYDPSSITNACNFSEIKNLKGKKLIRKLMGKPIKVPKWKGIWKD